MADLTPKVISIQHVPVTGTDLRLRRITRVTIVVGPYGPFSKDFDEGQDGPEAINQWKTSKMLDIQAVAG